MVQMMVGSVCALVCGGVQEHAVSPEVGYEGGEVFWGAFPDGSGEGVCGGFA